MKKALRNTIFLHIGTYKTGSTYLQATLTRHRDSLRNSGVIYPSAQPGFRSRAPHHHKIARALSQYSLKDRIKLWKFRNSLKRDLRDGRHAILSAESIYGNLDSNITPRSVDLWFRAHKRYLTRVSEYFGDYDVKPIVFFRDPEAFITSLYKELIAQGHDDGQVALEEFVELRAPLLDYSQHADQLRDVFGSLIVFSYENARQVGLEVKLAQALEISPDVISSGTPSDSDNLRKSISNKAARWLQMAHRAGGPSTHKRRLQYALRESDSISLRDSPNSTLWRSTSDQVAFFERFRSSFDFFEAADKPLQESAPLKWSSADQDAVDRNFRLWEGENLSKLEKREQLKLRFFEPDP